MIGTVLNERFSLEKELGRGGMGAVYKATDQLLGRSVAIKVLKELTGDEVLKKIRLEAQILARLVHESIVRLYDFGIANGTYFLVMEEVDGTSFHKRWKKINLPERMRILAQVADALNYAHRQGVIHRDVKPANILLTADDQAKLSDFGLSMLADDAAESGVTRGTPNYMSPEQARGKKLDHRSDLYALGVILYECASGTPPFQGPPMSVMSQHVSAKPERPRAKNPELSEALDDLVMRLLAKDPERRPASGQALARELRDLLANDAWFAPGRAATASTAPATSFVAGEAANAVTSAGTQGATPAAPSSPMAAAPSAGGLAPGRVAASSANADASPAKPTIYSRLPQCDPSLAGTLIEEIEAEPILLTADERYLCGHYLAYLLGGSRRQGLFRRRPLDRRNADRARLLLAMTSIMISPKPEESIVHAAELLESKIDVRPSLSPIVVMKYLASRATEPKRKRFRLARKKLREASPYAQANLVDSRGILNPGLMPQTLDDLRKIAPERTEVDDQLAERWNRLADVWRSNYEFREAVLRYATRRAHRDPASYNLWPEVVHPLIERARWQRRSRSRTEALWDALCSNFRIPGSGRKLDDAMHRAVPEQVAQELDHSIGEFEEEPQIEEPVESPDRDAERLSVGSGMDAVTFDELAAASPAKRGLVRLRNADPFRMTLADLGALWKEAITSLRTPGSRIVHRPVPIGPYRLAVIPTIRGRSAGTVAIQGMPNKQLEMLTPSLRGAGVGSRTALAVWLYENNSLVVSYLDFKSVERYILWDASTGQQSNFDDAGLLNSTLLQIGMEAPDQLDRALTKRFRPTNPV